MQIVPLKNKVAIEIILYSDARQKEIQKTIPGFQLGKAEFEGLPNQGLVYALPGGYSGPLVLGDHVVFKTQNPKGHRVDGKTIFVIEQSEVIAKVEQ